MPTRPPSGPGCPSRGRASTIPRHTHAGTGEHRGGCRLVATVTFEHVTKYYTPDYAAVNDLNLAIADGEFIVLVGPSGCGKTTTLRMLAGLEIENSGSIKIGDRIVNEVAPRDRDIAMVFQSYAL